jgi:hypothetical protein
MADNATGTTKTKRTAKPKGEQVAPPAAGTAAPESTAVTASTQADLPLEQTPEVQAEAPATTQPQGNLVDQLDIDELFPADGSFPKRGVFRFNEIYGPALSLRRAILVKIAKTPHEKLKSMSRESRNTMFSLIRSERGRYYGTAKRVMDNAEINAKKGDPLPKLIFREAKDGPVSTTIAAGYGRAIRWAGDNIRTAVFGNQSAPAQAVVEPAAAAA